MKLMLSNYTKDNKSQSNSTELKLSELNKTKLILTKPNLVF